MLAIILTYRDKYPIQCTYTVKIEEVIFCMDQLEKYEFSLQLDDNGYRIRGQTSLYNIIKYDST